MCLNPGTDNVVKNITEPSLNMLLNKDVHILMTFWSSSRVGSAADTLDVLPKHTDMPQRAALGATVCCGQDIMTRCPLPRRARLHDPLPTASAGQDIS